MHDYYLGVVQVEMAVVVEREVKEMMDHQLGIHLT
jgi:hypothetical protein